jgi:hypothetical protein
MKIILIFNGFCRLIDMNKITTANYQGQYLLMSILSGYNFIFQLIIKGTV